MLATDKGEATRASVSVARDTLLRVARADQLSADVSTGRGVATSHESVAASLGVCKKTVQRARKLLEAFGLAVTIVEGRYLSAAERVAARQLHGGRQIKAASVRALTVPKHLAGMNVHLPRRGEVLNQSPLRRNSPTRVPARTAPASRSRSGKRFEGRVRPRSVAMQRFAARLVDGVHGDVMERRMPWLLRARDGGRLHIGALCDVLTRAGVDPARWTPRELVETVDRWHQEHGRATLAGGSSDPLRYFAWQLQQAIDPNAPTHSERVQIRRAQLEAERNARAIEQEQERARMAAVDRDEVARIIAQMKADIAATSASRSRQKRHLR